MKNLIKSYKFWTALAGSIGLLLTLISEHIGIYINADGAKEIIMAVCSVLVVFGVVKKPQKQEESLPEVNLNQTNGVSLNQNQQDENN